MKTLLGDLNFPEGPAFDAQGNLWCVELKGGSLVRLCGNQVERHPTMGAPNGLTFNQDGEAWFCDSGQNAIRSFDPHTGRLRTIAKEVNGERLNKPNDLAFDRMGNLVFTCPGDSRTKPIGYVCCRQADGTVKKIADGFYFPNGLALTDDGRTLVIAETYRQRLWTGEWNEVTAEWTNAQPWADVGGPTGPDGMALGADGLLYVAVYGTGQIKVVDTAGSVVQIHEVPGRNPTNVAFDPSGKLGLVVTEAERGLLVSLPELGTGVALFTGSRA